MSQRAESSGQGTTGGPKRVRPIRIQVDPGLKDCRHYELRWEDGEGAIFADLLATNNAGNDFDADTEYWYADPAELSAGDAVYIRNDGDLEWGDLSWSPPSGGQEFEAGTSATWQQVGTDITSGTLYKLAGADVYVRIAITGTPPSASISVLRWYQKGSSQPTGTIDPSGTWNAVDNLGSGTAWYADSLSPS
jgi:hypothetical protein